MKVHCCISSTIFFVCHVHCICVCLFSFFEFIFSLHSFSVHIDNVMMFALEIFVDDVWREVSIFFFHLVGCQIEPDMVTKHKGYTVRQQTPVG